MSEQVILVDIEDNPIGTMDKLEAHQKGLLHRAFSIIVLNSRGELLLQKRASGKYHSGGLWTNTCCSHPRPEEDLFEAAKRRLMEEMGMSCELVYGFHFVYKVDFPNGLTEHEYDHIFLGWCDTLPIINELEVEEFRYMSLEEIHKDMTLNPSAYTEWFKILTQKIYRLVNKFE